MDDYAQQQENFLKKYKLKVGSKVKIFRSAEDGENGWPDSWVDGEMDNSIGKIVTISSITNKDIFFKEVGFGWPYFVIKSLKLRLG